MGTGVPFGRTALPSHRSPDTITETCITPVAPSGSALNVKLKLPAARATFESSLPAERPVERDFSGLSVHHRKPVARFAVSPSASLPFGLFASPVRLIGIVLTSSA